MTMASCNGASQKAMDETLARWGRSRLTPCAYMASDVKPVLAENVKKLRSMGLKVRPETGAYEGQCAHDHSLGKLTFRTSEPHSIPWVWIHGHRHWNRLHRWHDGGRITCDPATLLCGPELRHTGGINSPGEALKMTPSGRFIAF